MKALFICPSLGAGGAERHWSILVPGLRERGLDARVIALDGGGPFVEPLREAGVPLDVLYMRHQADLRALARSRLVRHFAPDVLVTRGVSGLYVGHAISRWRSARHIYNEHRQPDLSLPRRREAMARLLGRRLDLVIGVTPGQVATIAKSRVPRDRIVIVPNGVQAHRVSESRAAIRDELGIPDSAVVALLVASLRPEKRVADFVRAVSLARETQPALIGVIAGDGPERQAVQHAAGGNGGVMVLGHRDDVPRLLKAADVFALSSEYEALPMAILEAMAAGLPVVATCVGDIPTVVEDGVNGLLAEPRCPEQMASHLVTLAGDRRLRHAMGCTGERLHRELWDAERMIDEYARVLREVQPRRPKRAWFTAGGTRPEPFEPQPHPR